MAQSAQVLVRKVVMVPKAMAERIDDYRFRNRFVSEAEALRALLGKGLEAERMREAKGGTGSGAEA